jgi:hypothetical protein
MYPHRIRLAGPWEFEILVSMERNLASRERERPEGSTPVAHAPGSPIKVTLPCHFRDCGLADYSGAVRFARRFGYPGRIDDYERVWLTFAAVTGRAHVSLNSSDLGTITGAAEFEVTRLLQERNVLQVDIDGSGGEVGLHGEVALEVRRLAFLRNICVSMTDELNVSGEVAGSSDGLLEIYVVLDRKNVAYGTVQAGGNFHLTAPLVGLAWVAGAGVFGSPGLPPAGASEDSSPGHPSNTSSLTTHVVRVDLVQGASIWYRAEIQLARNS